MTDVHGTLVTYMSMVTALAVTINLILAPILASRRDKRLAAGTAQVAAEAKNVAKAVVEVKDELSVSKDEVLAHREDEKQVFSAIQDKVDKTHVIVNAQKTAMMQKLVDAQLFTLTLATAMLEERPENHKLRDAVAAADAIYKESLKDLKQKAQEEGGQWP